MVDILGPDRVANMASNAADVSRRTADSFVNAALVFYETFQLRLSAHSMFPGLHRRDSSGVVARNNSGFFSDDSDDDPRSTLPIPHFFPPRR